MIDRPNTALGQIHTQIMWNRLIAVVEEQAQTMLRTAFSTSVREAGDLSAGVFDRHGRMLAQAVTGTPGHVNSMANAVKHFLDVYPLATMKPGDHFITNDPWLTSGHLHDITVVTPSFYQGEAVGLFANTIHVVDIGGLGMGPDGRQVFEEGLSIPIMPLAREGRMNEDLLRVVRANVREPMQVEGDIYACAASNDEGIRRLVEMMDEFEIANLDRLGDAIVEASREATLARIRALPKGTYRNQLTMDGYEKPLVLNAALTISDEGLHVDFSGTSPASGYGINVVYNYCLAYTAFGVKCLVAPDVPNNAGSLAPITVSAPEGCVLNVKRPWPVAARHTVGQMLPDVVFGCLHQVVAGGVPASVPGSISSTSEPPPKICGFQSDEHPSALRHQGHGRRHLLGDDRQRFRRQEGQRRRPAHVPPHQTRLEGRNGPAPALRVPARSRSQNSVPDRQRRNAEALSDGRRPRHRVDAIRRRLGLVRGRIRALPAAHRPRRKGPGPPRDQARQQTAALARPLCGEYAGSARRLQHAGASLARLRGHGIVQGREVPLPAARRAALDRGGEEVGDRQRRARVPAHPRVRYREGGLDRPVLEVPGRG